MLCGFYFKLKRNEVESRRDASGPPRLRYARTHQNPNIADQKEAQNVQNENNEYNESNKLV